MYAGNNLVRYVEPQNPHQVGQWLDNQQAADFLAEAVKKGV